MAVQRIVSFLPSATEIVYALGAGDRLVGVTHECDFPPEARAKRVVVRPALQLETMSPGEIDAAVSGEASASRSVYNVDAGCAARVAAGPDHHSGSLRRLRTCTGRYLACDR